MKRLLGIMLLLLSAGGLMGQTPTSTPTPTGPAMCSVTGTVVNADGSPFINGTITFNSLRIQVINGYPVNPTVVTTNTDNLGNILAKSLPQGLAMQITICPGTQQTANCSAPFSAIIPFSQTANFGNLAQGTALTGSSALTVTTLNVTGSATISPTLLLPNTSNSSIYWGSLTTPVASINAYGSRGFNIAAGAHYNGSWIADAPTATVQSQENSGAMGYYYNTGLTVGSTFTPTELGYWGQLGLNLGTTLWAQSPANGASGSDGSINNNTQFAVPSGSSQELAALCSGAFIVTDLIDGLTALYMCGGGACALGPVSAGTFWVASTPTPAAGHASVSMDGNSRYTLYNNQGSTVSFMALTLCSRAGT